MTDTTTDFATQRIQELIDALNAAPNPEALSQRWNEASGVAGALAQERKLTSSDWADAIRALRAAWQSRRAALGLDRF